MFGEAPEKASQYNLRKDKRRNYEAFNKFKKGKKNLSLRPKLRLRNKGLSELQDTTEEFPIDAIESPQQPKKMEEERIEELSDTLTHFEQEICSKGCDFVLPP